MRASQVSASATGATTAVQISTPLISTFGNVGLYVTVPSTATVTYNVEVSGDPANPTSWNAHDVLQNKSASANSNIAYPCMWVRLNVLSYSGSGAVVLNVVQVI